MSSPLRVLQRISLVAILAVTVVAAIGVGNLKLNSHYTAYFDHDDPRLIANTKLSRLYSRQDSLFIALQSRTGFLNADNYQVLEDITWRLAEERFTTTALSISSLDILGETVIADGHLIPSLDQLLEEDLAIGLLLDETTRFAGIWLQLDIPGNNTQSVLGTMSEIRAAVLGAIRDREISAHFTGTLALNEAYIDVVRQDTSRIVPLLLIVMIVVLGWILKSFRSVLMMLPVGICACVVAFGIAGLFSAELAAINAFVPIMILGISQAGCIHVVLTYFHYREKGIVPADASVAAVKYNRLPMLLANGTTALGFLGLALSPSPPVRMVGYLVAIGITMSLILCMTLLPVLLAQFDPRQPAPINRSTGLEKIIIFVRRRRTGIIAVSLLSALPAGWLAAQNVVSDNVFEYFRPSHAFYQDTRLVNDHLSGVNEVLYSLESGEKFGVLQSAFVDDVRELSNWLEQQPEVNRVVSIARAQVLREARQQNRLQERLDFYRKRVSASDITIPLLPLGVSADYSSSAVTAYLKQLNSGELIKFDQRVLTWANTNIDSGSLRSGGPALMFANLGEQNIRGMLTALTIALMGASLIVGAVFRSVRLAGIGLACNILPVLLVYAVWAIAIGQISIGAAVVMGMILGILLDDTVYLLTTYERAKNNGSDDAAGYALRRVGPALIATTITLILGLGTGLLSEFGPIWNMSLLSASVIAIALVVDLLLLPAFLSTCDNDKALA